MTDKESEDDDVLLTPEETAKLLRVPMGTFRNHSRVLPRRKVGRGVRYLRTLIVKGVTACPPGENVFTYFARNGYGQM